MAHSLHFDIFPFLSHQQFAFFDPIYKFRQFFIGPPEKMFKIETIPKCPKQGSTNHSRLVPEQAPGWSDWEILKTITAPHTY